MAASYASQSRVALTQPSAGTSTERAGAYHVTWTGGDADDTVQLWASEPRGWVRTADAIPASQGYLDWQTSGAGVSAGLGLNLWASTYSLLGKTDVHRDGDASVQIAHLTNPPAELHLTPGPLVGSRGHDPGAVDWTTADMPADWYCFGGWLGNGDEWLYAASDQWLQQVP